MWTFVSSSTGEEVAGWWWWRRDRDDCCQLRDWDFFPTSSSTLTLTRAPPPPHNYKCSNLKPLFELLKLLKLHFAENVCYYVCKSMSLDCANLFTQQQMARPSAGWGHKSYNLVQIIETVWCFVCSRTWIMLEGHTITPTPGQGIILLPMSR